MDAFLAQRLYGRNPKNFPLEACHNLLPGRLILIQTAFDEFEIRRLFQGEIQYITCILRG